MPERAINIYREAGSLTFHASGPDRDPAYMVTSERAWRFSDGELEVGDGRGSWIRLDASEAALAATCGYWGLKVWWTEDAAKMAASAKKKRGAKR